MSVRVAAVLVVLACMGAGGARGEKAGDGPSYTPAGALIYPAEYRNWVFLTSGLDMSYSAAAQAGMTMFDNVFADPAAFAAFQRSGTWPDKTVLVMENRAAQQKGSINRNGHFQSGEPMGLEVHVKDTARFGGGWGFFAFDSPAPAALIPHSASCYACHQAHAAVDTTFVQFYPTLLPIAAAKHTLSAAYLAEDGK